jgi:hypothetical protein
LVQVNRPDASKMDRRSETEKVSKTLS